MKPAIDLKGVMAGLDLLLSQKESIARSMAVAGGKVIRDEAKARAPVDDGTLKQSIYLAYKDTKSTKETVMYSVSWNHKLAPHGHLLEFGHWQTRAAYKGKDGNWYSGKPLASPKWVEAKPFLRPAFDASLGRAQKAMLARGQQRFAEIASKKSSGGSDEA